MRKVLVDRSNPFRALLTDTLPYEVPMFFTNESFYFWLSVDASKNQFPQYVSQILLQTKPTKPFLYKVRKSGGGYRNLAIPHPAAQRGFAEFYRDFDAFIENVCARSEFSLRFPSRVGSHFYQSQYASATEQGNIADGDPSSFTTQRRWASSYFSYRRFTHIHKFFASREFLRLEQRFSWMLKLDISRCFESIYTHSVAWAVRGKEFAKDHQHHRFFESAFDKRMREANWGETSGILIGPEISRIFAEVIMQSIDVALRRAISPEIGHVAVARYVDDFFIFSNSRDVLSAVQSKLEDIASKFNLHFNQSKTELVGRPFVASFAVARQRVRDVLADFLRHARDHISQDETSPNFSSRAAEKVLAEIRRIASEHSVDYSMLASPALGVIARGIHRIRRRTNAPVPENRWQRIEVVNAAIIAISTFCYLMDIRSTTSDKLARIIFECSALNLKHSRARVAFEGMIQDSIRIALEQSRISGISGAEMLNVLVAVDAISSKVRGVSEGSLRSALGIDDLTSDGRKKLNYFDLVAVLYFSRDDFSFKELKDEICDEIEERIRSRGLKLANYAEESMLFFDFISCPYISESRRLALFSAVAGLLGLVTNQATVKAHFDSVKGAVSFVAWGGAEHFQAMLARRELQPAYDS